MKKFLFLAIFFGLIGFARFDVQAQVNGEPSQEQKEILRQRVVQKVDEFIDALTRMVDNRQSHQVRVENQKNLLNLFLGGGDPYNISSYDEKTKTEQKEYHPNGVLMWTSNLNSSVPKSQPLKNYIRRLYNPDQKKSMLPYSEIEISKAAAVRVDNIYREGDHYVCIATFYQDFYGKRDGKVSYSDRTGKQIKCYIFPIELPDMGVVGFDAKLGDITVVETSKIPKG